MTKLVFALSLFALISQAQTPTRSVTATGTATVFAPPDQVMIDASINTQGKTAQDAASANATQTNAVLAALNMLLGSGANIQTINYSVYPNYNYPSNGGTPTLVGYTASNTVEVTLTTLNLAGSVIDTAVQAGATSVAGLRFSLKNSEPAKLQALQQATMRAQSHAGAMASAAGAAVGSVTMLTENATVTPIYLAPVVAGATGTSTTVQPGLIQVDATVTLQATLM